MVARVDEDVSGLHVPMDETVPMGRVEGLGDLGHELQRPLGLERLLAREQPAQVGALDVAGRDVELALGLSRRVHGEDGGVVEGGRDPRLLEEALPERRVARELRRDQLERDRAVE